MLAEDELRREAIDECRDWLEKNPGGEDLPLAQYRGLMVLGLDARAIEDQLLRERNRERGLDEWQKTTLQENDGSPPSEEPDS
jgi:hypothetical protein